MFVAVATISPLVQADDVVAARELLLDVISPTPMLYSRVLSEHGGRAGLPEVREPAANRLVQGARRVHADRPAVGRRARPRRGGGERGQSRAGRGVRRRAARHLGHGGHAGAGAAAQGGGHPRLRRVGDPARGDVEDALDEALRFAEQTGAVFIHPFDHPDIVAGQGTLGFEIIEQCPGVRTILVPVGGGGLAAGITVAMHSLDPEVRVVGVQAEAVPGLVASVAAGEPVQVVGAPTMADGIAVQRPGDIPFGILAAAGGRIVAVSEAALARALLLCLERAKQVVEPAGAAGRGGAARGAGEFEPPVVVVLSGGNIDPLLLSKLLRHGLSAAGRFLGFRCRVPDYPGSLAALLGLLAGLGANVLEVSHERLAPTLRVDEVEVRAPGRDPRAGALRARQGGAPRGRLNPVFSWHV